MWKIAKEEREPLVAYLAKVRETIGNLDTVVVDLITRGGTLIAAILVIPWSVVHWNPGQEPLVIPANFYRGAFWVSLGAVAAAVYVAFTVSLYADLLKRAVEIGRIVELELLNEPHIYGITTVLEENPVAGGRWGRWLYLSVPLFLYLGTTTASLAYLRFGNFSYSIFSYSMFRIFVVIYIIVFVGLLALIYWQWHRSQNPDKTEPATVTARESETL